VECASGEEACGERRHLLSACWNPKLLLFSSAAETGSSTIPLCRVVFERPAVDPGVAMCLWPRTPEGLLMSLGDESRPGGLEDRVQADRDAGA